MTVNETVLITGASSGIGLEFAEIFARKKHYNLILVARRKNTLEEIKKRFTKNYSASVFCVSCDLSVPGASKKLFDQVQEKNLSVDILINNAALGQWKFFENISLSHCTHLIDLNVLALTELTHLFLPDMLKKKRGKILNVSSVVAFYPTPKGAVYGASKAYVSSFTNALGSELKSKGVQVSLLCPGVVLTGFADVAKNFEQEDEATSKFEKKEAPGRARGLTEVLSAKDVARIGIEGLFKGQRVIIPGIRNRWINTLMGMFPLGLKRKLVELKTGIR